LDGHPARTSQPDLTQASANCSKQRPGSCLGFFQTLPRTCACSTAPRVDIELALVVAPAQALTTTNGGADTPRLVLNPAKPLDQVSLQIAGSNNGYFVADVNQRLGTLVTGDGCDDSLVTLNLTRGHLRAPHPARPWAYRRRFMGRFWRQAQR
jgi:hypothetical protein